MNLQVVPSTPSDLSPVLTLLEAVNLPTEGVEEHFGDFLIARANERVVGCVALEKYGSHGLLRSLAVAPDFRGQALGLQPKHLLKEVISILNETFPKNIIVKDYVPSDLQMFSGDPTPIHQVLMNFCVNARDAMQPGGGTLTIEAENKFVDEQFAGMIPHARTGHQVVITIGDTSTGITPELLEKIFDSFFTTKEVGQGTVPVLGIVKSHNGFVNVCSDVGKGTEFQLYFLRW